MGLLRLGNYCLRQNGFWNPVSRLGKTAEKSFITVKGIFKDDLLHARLAAGTSRFLSQKTEDTTVAGIPYSNLKVSVPKEVHANERRVALSPQACKILISKGFSVSVERGAGSLAKFTDQDYLDVGAEVVDTQNAYNGDIVLKIMTDR